MRDFRDAKAMAQTIRAALAAKGHKISIGESLELIAKAFGAADWNTLSAAIRDAGKDEPKPPETAQPAPTRIRTGAFFTDELQATLHKAVAYSAEKKHQHTTLEHLLLALIDDADARGVLETCLVDVDRLRATARRHIDEDLEVLVADPAGGPSPTAGFHRVVQRAVIHIQASGQADVTGADLLVALFSERESHAAFWLKEQGVTRVDAVNFIVHGLRKDGGAAA